jgi:flagellar biosynthesis protein FlhG
MRSDQAEGLRRLLDRTGPRVVSISAGAADCQSETAINLAAALAELGNDPLILDGHAAPRGAAASLGLKPRFDLEQVIRRERDLDEVIVHGPGGIRILPLARGARTLAQLPAPERRRLMQRCSRQGLAVDTMLLDAAPGSACALLWPGAAARELIVLDGGSASAITAAYALIKRLSNEFARREFHVLVGNVASEREARAIFANIAGVARRYLLLALHFMGHIPPDLQLQRAARLRLPVAAAFPAAAAALRFRQIAQAIAGWPPAETDGGGFGICMRGPVDSSQPRAAAA